MEFIATLANCHAMTPLPFLMDQLERLSWCSVWADTCMVEMRNIRAYPIEQKAQLSVRNEKLVLLDTELCWSLAKDSLINMKEHSVIFIVCHKFIKIDRLFRYSPEHIRSLPSFIGHIFSRGSQQVIYEFSQLVQETLYHITGWTIHASNKVAPWHSKDTWHYLVYFVNSVTIVDLDSDQRCNLPTCKVD